eukprot:1147400-Pelagomonas_calceolata.AAC.2
MASFPSTSATTTVHGEDSVTTVYDEDNTTVHTPHTTAETLCSGQERLHLGSFQTKNVKVFVHPICKARLSGRLDLLEGLMD